MVKKHFLGLMFAQPCLKRSLLAAVTTQFALKDDIASLRTELHPMAHRYL